MKAQAGIVWALAILLASLAFGQTSAQFQAAANGGFSGSATFSGPPPFASPAVTGAPYSGEEVSEQVQTLMDGTHITRTMPGRRVYRDSQGRTRTERPLFMRPSMGQAQAPEGPMVVEITDPVDGVHYILDTANHVAHRYKLPPPGTRPGALMGMTRAAAGVAGGGAVGDLITGAAPAGRGTASGVLTATIEPPPMGGGSGTRVAAPRDGAMRPEFASESLGTQMIDGVLAEGRRTTNTFPVGMQGNDRPIVATHETWTSPELKITVLSKSVDPRSGENTFRIANLSRAEPDPILFRLPADYTIVDETGSFTINYSR